MALTPRIARGTGQHVRRKREGMSPSHEADIKLCRCLICGRARPYVTVEPHHLQRGLPPSERGMSRRAADKYLLPLCSGDHDLVEKDGDDEAALIALGIHGRDAAAELWSRRGDLEAMQAWVERSLFTRGIYIVDA